MDGKKRHSVEKLTAGDIGATLKLKSTETNDTLRDPNTEITIKPIIFPSARIRKAVGARRADIVSQFLLEAAIMTTIGGLCGVALAGSLGLILAYFIEGLPAVPPVWAILSGLSVSTIVGLIFGVWPAFKAARLDPIESLRYE